VKGDTGSVANESPRATRREPWENSVLLGAVGDALSTAHFLGAESRKSD